MAAQPRSNRWLVWAKGLLGAFAAVLVAAAVCVGVLLALLALFDPFDDAPHPSDAALIEQFHRERAALEALVEMIAQDTAVQRLAPDFARPEPAPLTPARIADYRQRLKAAGITHGFSHYGDEIVFMVSTRGLAIAGSAKSIVNASAPNPDAHLVDGDLDAAFAAGSDKDVLLRRPIAPGWWLELDAR